MKQRHIIALVLIATLLPMTGRVDGQDSGGTEDPLLDFLSRFSDSAALLTIKTKISIQGKPEGSSEQLELLRFRGELGFHSKRRNETEQRWIWNQDYVALMEKAEQGDWMLQKVMRSNTDAYETVLRSVLVEGHFLGGPMLDRMKDLVLSDVENQAEGSLFVYHYVPESPFFSSDPTLNSMSIRFDGTSEKARLLEINCWQSKEIEITFKYDYPEDSLFPLKRTMVAMGPNELRETTIETDSESQFDRSECYLGHYGLPEPKYARKNNGWIWYSLAALFVTGIGAFLWKRNAKSR